MNDKLASAFGEVTPVAGLADRLILRSRYRRRSMWLAGVAASTLLVGALSVTMLRPEAESPLAVAMLDHVIAKNASAATAVASCRVVVSTPVKASIIPSQLDAAPGVIV